MKALVIGHNENAGKHINNLLGNPAHSVFNFAVAYARHGGVKVLRPHMEAFAERGGRIHAIIGVNQGNTSYQGVKSLGEIADVNVSLRINLNKYRSTFHPKLYLFGAPKGGEEVFSSALIGSANLTRGGLLSNEECSARLEGLDADNQAIVKAHWDNFLLNNDRFITIKGSESLYDKMLSEGILVDETAVKKQRTSEKDMAKKLSAIVTNEALPTNRFFAMTLGRFDVSERSADPVILIPLKALKQDEKFWFYPNFFLVDIKLRGFRIDAEVEVDGESCRETVRLYEYPNKKEFRLQTASIKRNGAVGDIILVERTGGEMRIKLVRKGAASFHVIAKKMTQTVPSSKKRFGYFS